MKSNQFRLGNLVKLNINDTFSDRTPYFGKNIYRVVAILDDSIKIDLGFESQQRVLLDDPKLKPIKLTEEWLLKFDKNIKIPKWIKHVHALQNWYWVENKCKKELYIKI